MRRSSQTNRRMERRLNEECVRRVYAAFLSMDEFAFLLSKYNMEDWGINLPIESINKLKTLGYLDKVKGELTTSAYEFIAEDSVEVKDWKEEFQRFWDKYPKTDMWGRFPHTRNIRTNKEESFFEFKKLMLEYKVDDIINGLDAYIAFLKTTSTSSNSLKYIKSPLNFLRDKEFMDYKKEEKYISYGDDLA